MFSTEGPETYLERAEMHEHLAATTNDAPARKMHQAMATAYRRKASEAEAIQILPVSRSGPTLKLDAIVG